MARKPRLGSQSGVYHFINRGVNKNSIFRKPKDFKAFLGLIKEYKEMFEVDVYHYCILSNHFHFLVKTPEVGLLSKFAHFIQRRYAYYYCQHYHHSGQVFGQRFKSLPIEEDAYLLECGRYIERNPIAAKLVDSPENYPYSSCAYYLSGKADHLLTENPLYQELGQDPAQRKTVYRAYICLPRQKEVDSLLESNLSLKG